MHLSSSAGGLASCREAGDNMPETRTPPSPPSPYPSKVAAAVERDVRPWLDLVEALRSLGIQEDLPLPQIVVVGTHHKAEAHDQVVIVIIMIKIIFTFAALQVIRVQGKALSWKRYQAYSSLVGLD